MRTLEQLAAQAAKHRERYAANPELFKQRNKDHYARNRERMIARQKAYYEANREAVQASRKAHRDADIEATRAKGRARYAVNREARHESNRRWHERNPNKARAAAHGLTVEEYDALFAEQDGKCALCFNAFDERKPYIDHDHVTGEVRGLLCMNCNTALGHFRDDPYLMRRAADYVQWRPLREEAAA